MPSPLAAEFARMNTTLLEAMGSSATYVPKVGTPFTITVIPVDPTHLEWLNPGQWTVRWTDLSQFASPPLDGDSITIDAVSYDVVNVRARHNGSVFLVLSKA